MKVSSQRTKFQRVLIGPMEAGDGISSGGWRMKDALVETAEGTECKIGRNALVFAADAEIEGAKGDFSIHGPLPGKTHRLGLWVKLEDDANINRLGIQVYDAEGEALLMLAPATWTGWKWIEFGTIGDHVQQAYPQADKNDRIDQPLKSQQVVWFAESPGTTRMTVDGMVALVDRSELADNIQLTPAVDWVSGERRGTAHTDPRTQTTTRPALEQERRTRRDRRGYYQSHDNLRLAQRPRRDSLAELDRKVLIGWAMWNCSTDFAATQIEGFRV